MPTVASGLECADGPGLAVATHEVAGLCNLAFGSLPLDTRDSETRLTGQRVTYVAPHERFISLSYKMNEPCGGRGERKTCNSEEKA